MADPLEHLLWHPRLRHTTVARRYRYLRRRLRQWPDMEGLQAAGLRVGRDVRIMSGAYIDPDFAWLIEIGDDSGLSYEVVVLAHDASTRRHLGYTRVAPVRIGSSSSVLARSSFLV